MNTNVFINSPFPTCRTLTSRIGREILATNPNKKTATERSSNRFNSSIKTRDKIKLIYVTVICQVVILALVGVSGRCRWGYLPRKSFITEGRYGIDVGGSTRRNVCGKDRYQHH